MTNPPELTQFFESLKADLVQSLQDNGKLVTGQTAMEIAIVDEENAASLQFPAYLLVLEYGRGPTPANAPIGSPPMINRIRAWCNAKGIPEKAIWAIKKSIDKKGFQGIPGLMTVPLGDDNINLQLNKATFAMAEKITRQIIDTILPT